jgi:hypothetical protein
MIKQLMHAKPEERKSVIGMGKERLTVVERTPETTDH